jgi:hypothetical protein
MGLLQRLQCSSRLNTAALMESDSRLMKVRLAPDNGLKRRREFARCLGFGQQAFRT